MGAVTAQPGERRRLVSAILVTWNSARFLPRCLAGLRAQSYGNLELIAVDNGSADDSAAIVEKAFPDARVIRNDANAGFSAAVNQATELAGGEFVLLCNPDAFLEPQYVEALVEALDCAGEEFGSATGTLFRAEGEEIRPTSVIDSKGIRMTRNGRHLDIGQGRPDRAAERGLRPLSTTAGTVCDGVSEVFGVSGAAAMFRMAFVRQVSEGEEFFDEDFFAFREDADLAWRGRLFGWRALHSSRAIGHHVRTVTPERRRALPPSVNMHSVKNRFLLRLKNEGFNLALRNALFEIPRDFVTIAAVLTVERSSLPALVWLWRNRKRIAAKRREVQRRRVVTDRAIAEWFA